MRVIYCYLPKHDDKFLRFHMNNCPNFEINPAFF